MTQSAWLPRCYASLLVFLGRLCAQNSWCGASGGVAWAGIVPSEYTCEVEQLGFHILEREACGIRVWEDAHRTREPLHVAFEAGDCSPAKAVAQQLVEQRLQLAPRVKYQQPWRYFTPQGDVVRSGADWNLALSEGPIFLIEGGQFQWPPVRIGHRQKVQGLSVNGVQIELETLALRPPIFRINDLATVEESDELIKYASPHFEKSDVVYMDADRGADVDEFRTSLDHRPGHNETPLVAAFEARASQVTRIPSTHFESMQILSYEEGGFYHAHDDVSRLEFYLKDRETLTRNQFGHFDRMITVFWYMNTVASGGETNFPMADTDEEPRTMDECYTGLYVKAVKGHAILWYNLLPSGATNDHALHAACKVGEGQKFAINIWVYNKPEDTPPAVMDKKHPSYIEVLRKAHRAENDDEDDEDEEDSEEQGYDEDDEEENGADKVELTIENDSRQRVHIFWTEADSTSRERMFSLAAGASRDMGTFMGHTFDAAEELDAKPLSSYTLKPSKGKHQIFRITGSEL